MPISRIHTMKLYEAIRKLYEEALCKLIGGIQKIHCQCKRIKESTEQSGPT